MKEYYCWRCEIKVPMLEEHEWAEVEPLLVNQLKNIKSYRAEHGVNLDVARQMAFKPATDRYLELTGFKEANYAAIYHHRLNDYGPECVSCGHLFRTARASFCANCGLTIDKNN